MFSLDVHAEPLKPPSHLMESVLAVGELRRTLTLCGADCKSLIPIGISSMTMAEGTAVGVLIIASKKLWRKSHNTRPIQAGLADTRHCRLELARLLAQKPRPISGRKSTHSTGPDWVSRRRPETPDFGQADWAEDGNWCFMGVSCR